MKISESKKDMTKVTEVKKIKDLTPKGEPGTVHSPLENGK